MSPLIITKGLGSSTAIDNSVTIKGPMLKTILNRKRIVAKIKVGG